MPEFDYNAALAMSPNREDYETVREWLDAGSATFSDALITPTGVLMYFDDWTDEDLLTVFEDSGRNRCRDQAKTLFGGDAYEWFDLDYRTSCKEVLRYHSLDEQTWKLVGQALIDSESECEQEDADGDTQLVPVTQEILDECGVEETLLEVAELDDNDDVVRAVRYGYDQAERSAREGAFYKGYTEAVEEVLGPSSWTGPDGQKQLTFLVPYATFVEMAENYEGDCYTMEGGPGVSCAFLAGYVTDKATVNDDYWASVKTEDFSEAVRQHLP